MKKTIFVLAIIAALAIALYKWLTNGENEETVQETTEEVKEEPANNQQNDVIQMIQMHQNGSSIRKIADKYGTYPMDVCRKIKAFEDSH